MIHKTALEALNATATEGMRPCLAQRMIVTRSKMREMEPKAMTTTEVTLVKHVRGNLELAGDWLGHVLEHLRVIVAHTILVVLHECFVDVEGEGAAGNREAGESELDHEERDEDALEPHLVLHLVELGGVDVGASTGGSVVSRSWWSAQGGFEHASE